MKRWIPVAVFVLGLAALTAWVALTLDRGPFERSAFGEETVYWDTAVRIAGGDTGTIDTGSLPSPLYPQLLSAVASDEVGAVRHARAILTAILLPLISILVLALAWRRAGPWPATIAGLAAAAAGPLAFNAGAFSPALPAAVVGLMALVVLDGKPNLGAWAVGGILAGVVGRFDPVLGWALGILLLGGALVRPGLAPRAAAALIFAAAWLGGAWVSGTAGGARHPVPVVHGIDVYRGHRAEASGVVPVRGDQDSQRWWTPVDYTLAAARRTERRLDGGEVDRYWAGRAAAEAVQHPLAEIRRTGVKLLAGLQGDPLARAVSPAYLIEKGDTATGTVVLWVGRILLPLGLAGLVVARRKAGWILWAGALSAPAAALVTFAGADSRQLTVSVLLVGLALLARAVRLGPGRKRLVAAAVSVGAVAVFGLWPAFGGVPGQDIQTNDYYQLGAVYDRDARGSTAMREYERALRLDADNPYPTLALAIMLARDNVLDEAIRELESLRERRPDFIPGLSTLVRLYERQQRWAEAAAVYGYLINLNPFNAEYLNNLATMYAKMGYYDQAEAALQAALTVEPSYQVARENLEGLRARGLALGGQAGQDPFLDTQERIVGLVRAGEYAAAADSLAAAFSRYGNDRPELQYLLGSLRLTEGRSEEAVRIFEGLRDEMDQNPLFLNNLAAAYAGAGDMEKATETWKEALRLQPDNERIRRSLERAQAQLDSLEAK